MDIEKAGTNELARSTRRLLTANIGKSRNAVRPDWGNFEGFAISLKALESDQRVYGFVVKVPRPGQSLVAAVRHHPDDLHNIAYVVESLKSGQVPKVVVVDHLNPGQRKFGYVVPIRKRRAELVVDKETGDIKVSEDEGMIIRVAKHGRKASHRPVGLDEKAELEAEPKVRFEVKIDGEWTAAGFEKFFTAVERLYLAFHDLNSDEMFGRLDRRRFPQLRVVSVSYASPGGITFEGSGEVVKEVREGIKDIAGRHKREIAAQDVELAKARQELAQQVKMDAVAFAIAQMDALQKYIETARLAGFSDEEIKAYAQRAIAPQIVELDSLAAQGMVVGVTEVMALPPNEDDEDAA